MQTAKATGDVFSGRCNEGLEIGIESKRDGKRVKFCRISKRFSFFRISDGLSGMLTAFGEMILETVFVIERMKAVRTNEVLSSMTCSAIYESRKTLDPYTSRERLLTSM